MPRKTGTQSVKVYNWNENYHFMGNQTGGSYEYFGFKQRSGTSWYIMRRNTGDDSAWAYAFSTTGGNSWTTAWTTPGGETYADPPDS